MIAQAENLCQDERIAKSADRSSVKLTIVPELESLLPPLTKEEFEGLKRSLLENGCYSSLITWNKIVVDGHNRYRICTEHNIPFETQEIECADIDEAKLWAIRNQGDRRNMSAFARAELVLGMKDIIAAKAKQRQKLSAGRGKKGKPMLANQKPVVTRDEMAKMADVSHGTLDKIEYVAAHADEETKAKLRVKGSGLTVNKEYNRLKAKKKAAAPNTPSEESVDARQFFRKHYHASQIGELADDISNAFPRAILYELPFVFFQKAIEHPTSDRTFDQYLVNFISTCFEKSSPEIRDRILRELGAIASEADESRDT